MANETGTELVQENPNQLIPQELMGVRSKYADEAAHQALASGSFLPRIQQMQGLSKLVSKKKSQAGNFVLCKGSDTVVQDYGDQFSCLILNWRPKAVKFDPQSGKGKAYFNPKGKDFQAVEIEGSKKPRPRGFLFGPEYLIYLPDVDQIATLHFATPTMRNRAGEMKALIGCAATILSEMIEAGGNTWYGPNVTGCSTPLPLPEAGSQERNDLNDRFRVAMEKFCQTTEGEEVEEVGEGGPSGTPEAVGSTSARPQ